MRAHFTSQLHAGDGEMGMNPMTDVAIVLATITVIAVSILLVLL